MYLGIQLRDKQIGWSLLLLFILLVKSGLTLVGKIPPVWVFGGVYFLLLICAAAFALANALRSNENVRIFWIFVAAGFALWAYSQCLVTYYAVVAGADAPDSSSADPALFLHVVPFMAAAAMQPHLRRSAYNLTRESINFLVLLFVWVCGYAYFVFPYGLCVSQILRLQKRNETDEATVTRNESNPAQSQLLPSDDCHGSNIGQMFIKSVTMFRHANSGLRVSALQFL